MAGESGSFKYNSEVVQGLHKIQKGKQSETSDTMQVYTGGGEKVSCEVGNSVKRGNGRMKCIFWFIGLVAIRSSLMAIM